MTAGAVTLGGRLPLYDREGLTPVQKDLFDWQMREAVPWGERCGLSSSYPGRPANRTL